MRRFGGYYDYELTRTDTVWKAAKMKFNLKWAKGNQQLLYLAGEQGGK